jgi:protein involved in polysaccharide export with SLBB domain
MVNSVMNIRSAIVLLLSLSSLSCAAASFGPSEVDRMSIGRSLPLVTRPELEESLQLHQAIVDSAGTKDSDREKAIEAIEYIRSRLQDGDFRAGDQIVLSVEGDHGLPDTLVVEGGPAVLLPNIGTVSLHGILRSELEDHLTAEIGRYLRDPVVRVWPTIRLTIGGNVARPGFYTLPADLPLGDAVMLAGGPTGEAKMEAIKIKREGLTLMGGEELQRAIALGQTFDQLGMRPGDEVDVPEKLFTTRRMVTLGISAATFLLLGFRFYGG